MSPSAKLEQRQMDILSLRCLQFAPNIVKINMFAQIEFFCGELLCALNETKQRAQILT